MDEHKTPEEIINDNAAPERGLRQDRLRRRRQSP